MLQSSLTKMDGVSAMKGFYTFNSKNNLIIDSLINAYAFIVAVGAIPLRFYFRKNMGERAISPFAFLVSLLVYGVYGLFVGGLIGLWTYKPKLLILLGSFAFSPLFWGLSYLVIKGIKHFKQVIRKAQSNKVSYSYYRGDGSHFEYLKGATRWGMKMDDNIIRMILEPLFMLKRGVIVLFLAILINSLYFSSSEFSLLGTYVIWIGTFGFALIFSSLCLFLEEFGIMMRTRATILDLIDAEHDMKFVTKKKNAITEKVEHKKLPETSTEPDDFAEIIEDESEVKKVKEETDKDIDIYEELKSRILNDILNN